MGRMYDNSPTSKYSPLSNTKLVEEARNTASCVHEGNGANNPVSDSVDNTVVVDIDSLEIEEGSDETRNSSVSVVAGVGHEQSSLGR